MTLGGPIHFYVTVGDSILCSGADVGGGIGANSVLWTPNQGLIDSTSFYFWAKPDTTTAYTATITDSMGCSQSGLEGIVVVNVFALGIEGVKPNSNISVYPNPASGFIQIETRNGKLNDKSIFTLYDILGKDILSTSIHSKQQQIDVSKLARGSYSYRMGNSTGRIVLR